MENHQPINEKKGEPMAALQNARNTCRPAREDRVSLLDLMALHRQRRALARQDADALEDLGLTRAEADAEARRRFWDIPANAPYSR